MSEGYTTVIKCDGCGKRMPYARTKWAHTEVARQHLNQRRMANTRKRRPWVSVVWDSDGRMGSDYCPECVDSGRHSEKLHYYRERFDGEQWCSPRFLFSGTDTSQHVV